MREKFSKKIKEKPDNYSRRSTDRSLSYKSSKGTRTTRDETTRRTIYGNREERRVKKRNEREGNCERTNRWTTTRENDQPVNHDEVKRLVTHRNERRIFLPFQGIRRIEWKGRFPVALKKGECKLDITSCSQQSVGIRDIIRLAFDLNLNC